jgi:preprotein translocase subunit YajC
VETFTIAVSWWVLAQDPGGAANAPPPGGSIIQFLTPLLIIGAVFYLLLIRPEKKRAAEHQALLESLKKNDRVITNGGIYGVVANVQRDADRVTLKVDETNNTKIDVTFGSIAKILSDDSAGDKSKDS